MGITLKLHDANSSKIAILIPAAAFTVIGFVLGAKLHLMLGSAIALFFIIAFSLYRANIIDVIDTNNGLTIQCGKRTLHFSSNLEKFKVYKVFGNPLFVVVIKSDGRFPRMYFGSYFNTSRGGGKAVVDELKEELRQLGNGLPVTL